MTGIDTYEHMQTVANPLLSRVLFITTGVMSEDTMAFLSRAKAPALLNLLMPSSLESTQTPC
jgi:hypothetical protein